MRGDSAMDATEVVVAFKEAVVSKDAEKKKGKLRYKELEGLLVAEMDKWRKGGKWNAKGEEEPERAVRMPNELWGCPLLAEWRGAKAVADVGPEPADVDMDAVVRRREEVWGGAGGRGKW